MSLAKEIEKIVDQRLNERLSEITMNQVDDRPALTVKEVAGKINKSAKWVRDTFTTPYLVKKGIVKKIGGEWSFLNPEFLNFYHDEWFKKQ
ncbi:hypothetical protein I6N96_03345 [Enterococcus sp. BWM-S5]|uniref:Helix-turn-helix domain-containing protein n=1 Tax=Enterococcus larvae TaxID=2794352 RepID=A0ABS4CFU1_9ENTE|nr:hypothetical protein [Enterococcus larvae]MBP1045298.1 hypothetical protein [Enterococcus larvae]